MKAFSNPVHPALKYLSRSSSWSIIGFARSLLAIGLLLTLLFNPIDVLIPAPYLASFNQGSIKFHSNFFLIFGPRFLFLTRILAIALLIMVVSGYFMQLTSILHFWITASLVLVKATYLGGDNVNMLLTLLLVPVCIFDTRKNHWDTPGPADHFGSNIQNLFLFLVKIQVAWIYLDSVWLKLHVKEWRNGTVLYYWFNHNFFGLNPPFSVMVKPLLERLPVSVSITWGALIFEVLLAIGFLFSAKVKMVLLKWGIVFHFMILLIHGLAWLFFAMSAALFLYLWPSNKSFKLNLF